VNVAFDEPPFTVTVCGRERVAVLLLKATTSPSWGALVFRNTVQVTVPGVTRIELVQLNPET
jgi:hypothetical protein